jgi:pimeloyl-ACP methyl ester carboxylesterase
MERTLSSRLDDHFQFIFFDMRGSGRSGGSVVDCTLEQVLADLDGLREALGHEKIAIIGWSMISLLAIDLAVAFPERISHLILIGGLTHFGQSDDRYWDMLASSERKTILEQNNANLAARTPTDLPASRVVALQYAANGPRYWCDPTFDCLPLYGDDEWDVTLLGQMVQILQARHPEPSVIEGVSTPIFLAQGVWDFVCPPLTWYELIATYPDCTYHAFERSGHYPFYEEQDAFNDKLIAWINRA